MTKICRNCDAPSTNCDCLIPDFGETAMKDKDAYKSIYLTQQDSNDEHSWLWCEDKVSDDDIKYIRADLCTTYQDEWIKDVATEFYYHWHNSGGANTADGFDDWWEINKARFIPQPPTSKNETPGL